MLVYAPVCMCFHTSIHEKTKEGLVFRLDSPTVSLMSTETCNFQ